MRQSPATIAGLVGWPVAAVTIIALLPWASGRKQTSAATGRPASTTASAAGSRGAGKRDTVVVDETAGFHRGRDLLYELNGGNAEAYRQNTTRAMVVVLPDPQESSLDWTYDAELSAVRQSLQQAGYLGDRMWFPDARDSVLWRDGASISLTRPASEVVPGVMLFRGPGAPEGPDALVVYVVGELPTSGVHPLALKQALDEASVLDTSSVVRILGPTFSGTFASLRATIHSWSASHRCVLFRIVTGSATSAEARHGIAALGTLPCESSKGTRDGLSTSAVSFSATVHDDDEYLEVLEGTLARLGLKSGDVALMREAGTAYGQTPNSDTKTDSGKQASRAEPTPIITNALEVPFPLNVAVVRTAYERNPEPTQQGGVSFTPTARLPLSLTLGPRPRQEPVPQSRLTAPSVDLELSDAMETLMEHRIRAVGLMASDVRDKLFLAELVRQELPDEILFTLEGNVLFAREDLWRVMRGTVVVSTYPLIREDGAWIRSRDYTAFPIDGAAGVYNAAAILVDHPGRVLQYRAPLRTPIQDCLGRFSGWMLRRFGRPAYPVQACDSARNPDRRPPVWLTMVGSGMILPLAVIPDSAVRAMTGEDTTDLAAVPTDLAGSGDSTQAAQGVEPLPSAQFRPGVLGALGMVLGAGILLLASLIAATWLARRKPAPAKERPTPWWYRPTEFTMNAWAGTRRRDPGTTREERWAAWDMADALAMTVAVFSGLAPLAVLNGIAAPWKVTHVWLMWLGLGLALELFVIWALLSYYLVRRIRSLHMTPDDWTQVGAALLAHLLAVVLGILALVYSWQLVHLAATDPVKYGLYRFHTLDLDSGVSGMVPLLVVVLTDVLLVLWHRDRRVVLLGGIADLAQVGESGRFEKYLATSKKDPNGKATDDVWSTSFARVGESTRKIRESARLSGGPTPVLLLLLSVVAVVVVAVAALSPGHAGLGTLRTLENVTLGAGAVPTAILWIGLVCGFFGVLATLIHMCFLWFALRSFLGSLADTPIGAAFSRIPERLRPMGRLHLFGQPSGRLGHVLAQAGHDAAWNEGCRIGRLDPDDPTGAKVGAKGPPGDGGTHRESRESSQVALLDALRRTWSERPNLVWAAGSENPKKERSKEGSPEDEKPKEAKRSAEDAVGAWLRQVEDLFAVEGTIQVGWALRSLRWIVILMLGVILFTTAMLESIPFSHHTSLTDLFIILVIVALGLVSAMMLQLAKDDVLSRINGTDPGRLNFRGDSLLTALVFVVVPVFGLLGAELAPVGRSAFGWVTNLLRVLSGG